MLKVRFKDIRLKKIEHGQFALTDANTKRDLDLSQPWARCFRPGQTVLMSMLFTTSVQQQNICPSCQGSNAYEQDKEVEWYVYQRKYNISGILMGVALIVASSIRELPVVKTRSSRARKGRLQAQR